MRILFKYHILKSTHDIVFYFYYDENIKNKNTLPNYNDSYFFRTLLFLIFFFTLTGCFVSNLCWQLFNTLLAVCNVLVHSIVYLPFVNLLCILR